MYFFLQIIELYQIKVHSKDYKTFLEYLWNVWEIL